MIITAAEKLLLDLGVSSPRDIDLEAIAWTRGAIVHKRPLDNCEATIVGSQKRAIITVNSKSIPRRQRYSLAHEIGHWHFHKGQALYCGTREIGRIEYGKLDPERQADEFASDLILPNYLFRPFALRLKKPTLAAVREIADEFQASLTATYFKLLQSDLYPLVIVCHNKFKRKWFKAAPSVPGYWFPRDDLDPDSFTFDMQYKGAAEKNYASKIGAGAWFGFRDCDRHEIFEQSFQLPNDETLTVLTLPSDA